MEILLIIFTFIILTPPLLLTILFLFRCYIFIWIILLGKDRNYFKENEDKWWHL